MAQDDILLEVEGLTKIYGQHKALDRVSFVLKRGEIHCLVGENGAGKSTLIKILSGAIAPEEGSISLLGRKFKSLTPRESMELGLSTIYQDVELIESLSVADNIFLGSEKKGMLPFVIDTRSQNEKARDILDLLHIDIDEKAIVENLTPAKKQMLQIVKALHRDAKILIMDEPTSSLGLEETQSLMKLVGELKAKGIGIIYISHYLEEIFQIGDTITILKDGEYVGTYPKNSIDVETVIRKMVGRDASLFFRRERVPLGGTSFEVRHLSQRGVVDDVSFSVRSGEIFGFGGLVGSGRTELVNLICGIVRRDSGEILLSGRKLTIRRPKDAIKAGICLITEDRKKYALFGERSVTENVMIISNELFGGYILKLREENSSTDTKIGELKIAVSSRSQTVRSLSGGNQQKTVIARWLLSRAEVFIFDEPTKGIDIGAKEDVYKLILELARGGKSVIMISSDMPELISMSDRIGVMRNGRLIQVLEGGNVKEEDLIHHFIGM